MAEISNNPETNKAAWSFYSLEKENDQKLNDAIKKSGEPQQDNSNSTEVYS